MLWRHFLPLCSGAYVELLLGRYRWIKETLYVVNFCFGYLLGVAVLYAPGYLAARAVSLERFASVAVAPAFSVAALVILGVVLNAAHVRCDGWMLLLACAALCLLILWCMPRASRFEGC